MRRDLLVSIMICQPNMVVYSFYGVKVRINIYPGVNPLSPKSNQHEISPYHINALENRVVMRTEYMIREDESN